MEVEVESDEEFDFEEQIRLQEAAKANEDARNKGKVRKDSDGTEYEWDSDKKAWFPKLDADFLAQYQMNYGSGEALSTTTAASSTIPPAPADVNSSEYRTWYYTYYSSASATQTTNIDTAKSAALTSTTTTTDSKEYESYYKNYYQYYYQQNGKSSEEKDGENKDDKPGDTPQQSEEDRKAYEEYYKEHYKDFGDMQKDPSEMTTEEKLKYEEAWNKYYQYYYGQQGPGKEDAENVEGEKKEEEEGKKEEDKKGKKRKVEPKKPPEWFEASEDKNTNVYVTGLPEDITMEEYETLMKRFGLIMFDPFTRKPKLKLYKDKEGNIKGDGLCCYIKQESVQLCLDLMDGSDIRGYKVYVEKAKFEKKGAFDPNLAKKKKLSNKQKKKMKEKQEKLFAWKPDQEEGGRQRCERIIVVKNCFDPSMFEDNPAKINEIRDKLRDECNKYAEVKKVNVYDRHFEGVCTVAFKTPEEADMCIEAINGRYFGNRVIKASSWDGKTKYEVKETEEEEKKRIKQWEDFLEGSDASKQASQTQQESDSKKDKQVDNATPVDSTKTDEKSDDLKIEQKEGDTSTSVEMDTDSKESEMCS